MARAKAITKEVVLAAKSYSAKYPNMSQEEIGKLCGVSRTSIRSILSGQYDDKLDDAAPAAVQPGASAGELASAVKTAASNVNEQLYQLRSDMNERCTELWQAVEEIGEMLNSLVQITAQVGYMLANMDDPNHVKAKATAAHFRDEITRSRRTVIEATK